MACLAAADLAPLPGKAHHFPAVAGMPPCRHGGGIDDLMREDRKTVRRSRPIARLVLGLLVIALIVLTIAYLLLAGTERIIFADQLEEAPPPSRVLAELAPGETALAAVLKRDAFGGIEEFALTDQRLIWIWDEYRWSFPLARWNGYGYSTEDGLTHFELSTFEHYNIFFTVEASPAAKRLQALLVEAYRVRPERDETTPENEIPPPRPLRPFEHPAMGYYIWLAPLGLGLLGLFILSIGLRSFSNARHRVRHQRRAIGTVFGHVSGSQTSDEGHSDTVYHPLVEFTAFDGRRVTFKSRLATGGKKPLGHSLKVLYDPRNPEDAVIHGIGPLYFVSIVAGILGLSAAAWAASLVWLILSEL